MFMEVEFAFGEIFLCGVKHLQEWQAYGWDMALVLPFPGRKVSRIHLQKPPFTPLSLMWELEISVGLTQDHFYFLLPFFLYFYNIRMYIYLIPGPNQVKFFYRM